MEKEDVLRVLYRVAEDLNATLERRIELDLGADAPVFGGNGALSSVDLVYFLAAVEQELEETFDLPLILADERAVSQGRSPFRTLGSLADYVVLRAGDPNV